MKLNEFNRTTKMIKDVIGNNASFNSDRLSFTSVNGTKWNAVISYATATPLVSFYDADNVDPNNPDDLGLVTPGTYSTDSLIEDYHTGIGLTIDANVPQWTIDSKTMDQVRIWLDVRT